MTLVVVEVLSRVRTAVWVASIVSVSVGEVMTVGVWSPAKVKLPDALATLVTEPASMSAWVTV